MTSSDFDSLIRSYGKWLSDNTTYTQLDEWYEVNVPLLDEDNDYTQFYVKPWKNSVTFSDDCATSRRLESHGMTVTESRLAVLKDILNQFGIERNGDELTLTSDTADFADAKNRFLQAIIKVGDMSMLANPMCRRILQMTFVCSLMRTTYGMWKTFNSVASLVCCARMTLCCRSRVNRRNDSAHLLRGLPSDSFPVPYFHGRIRRRQWIYLCCPACFFGLLFVDVYGFCSSLFYRVAFRSRVISRLFIWLRRIPWRVP